MPGSYFKHIGLYVYRREFLLRYPDLTIGPLERPSVWSSFAPLRMAIGSASSRPIMSRWVSILPKIWSGSTCFNVAGVVAQQ